MNIRVTASSVVLCEFFRSIHTSHRAVNEVHLQVTLDKGIDINENLPQHLPINNNKLTARLRQALNTGCFSTEVKGDAVSKKNITQLALQINASTLQGYMARVANPIGRDGKNLKVRQMDGSWAGRFCVAETPEGASCGLENPLACLSHYRGTYATAFILDILEQLRPTFACTAAEEKHSVFVIVNGRPLFRTAQPQAFCAEVRAMRRISKALPYDIGVAYVRRPACPFGEIRINCDAGELLTPVFVVSHMYKLWSLQQYLQEQIAPSQWFPFLLNEGVIEYVGIEEQLFDIDMLTAPSFSEAVLGTHAWCDILPGVTLFGPSAAALPAADKNQINRASYTASMKKAAHGSRTPAALHRLDVHQCELNYPQRPLYTTAAAEPLGEEDYPSGEVLCVAVMKLDGDGVEDAIIVKKELAERGGLVSTVRRVYKECEYSTKAHVETFGIPNMQTCQGIKVQNYSKINPLTGTVDPGTIVTEDDIVISKYSKHKQKNAKPAANAAAAAAPLPASQVMKDLSTVVKKGEKAAMVEAVYMGLSVEGNRLVKVVTRETRIPEIGDKLSTFHGQKGVISSIRRAIDLPFTASGMIPDVIVNPCGYPSRMTQAQPEELLAGKYAACSGQRVDLTSFEDPINFAEAIQKYGHSWTSKEVMYDGVTGRKMQHPIAIGFLNVMRLKHLASDKLHARARGRRLAIVKQPVEGRARDGGLRFGEMERDALLAHGASATLLDRLIDCSDVQLMLYCPNCCNFAERNEEGTGFCRYCDNKVNAGLLEAEAVKPTIELALPQAAFVLAKYVSGLNMRLSYRVAQ